MAYGPDLGPFMAGETVLLSAPFGPRLAIGEALVTVQAGVQLWQASPIADPNAAALLLGSPFISGSSVVSVVGGAFVAGVSGLQPGAVYSIWSNATTSGGQTLEYAANFVVQPYTPPTFGSGPPAGSEFSETAAFTPSAPGTYFLNASNIPMTIPASNLGSDILMVDKTGAPNLTIIGALLNGLPVLGPYGTFTLRWSALYSGYFWK